MARKIYPVSQREKQSFPDGQNMDQGKCKHQRRYIRYIKDDGIIMWFKCTNCGKVVGRIVIDAAYADWLKRIYTDKYWAGSHRQE